jgi:hypothetical protein
LLRRRWRVSVVAAVPHRLPVTLALLLAAAGCGGSGSAEERRDIRAVADAARDAFVAGRAKEACALLTPHGRERAREFGPAYENTASCEDAVEHVLEIERDPRVDSEEREKLAEAQFDVVEVDGSKARVTVAAYSESVTVEVRKTPDGWRIHDSEVVPEGD